MSGINRNSGRRYRLVEIGDYGEYVVIAHNLDIVEAYERRSSLIAAAPSPPIAVEVDYSRHQAVESFMR